MIRALVKMKVTRSIQDTIHDVTTHTHTVNEVNYKCNTMVGISIGELQAYVIRIYLLLN